MMYAVGTISAAVGPRATSFASGGLYWDCQMLNMQRFHSICVVTDAKAMFSSISLLSPRCPFVIMKWPIPDPLSTEPPTSHAVIKKQSIRRKHP